jgi:hypothetical protein
MDHKQSDTVSNSARPAGSRNDRKHFALMTDFMLDAFTSSH